MAPGREKQDWADPAPGHIISLPWQTFSLLPHEYDEPRMQGFPPSFLVQQDEDEGDVSTTANK